MSRMYKLIVATVCTSVFASPGWARNDSPGRDDVRSLQQPMYSHYESEHHPSKKRKRNKKYRHYGYDHKPGGKQRHHGEQDATYDYARVIDVEPIVKRVRVMTPQRHCWEAPVRRHRGGYRTDSFTPLILGGILGGVVGNQLGGGTGNDLLTVGGVILGASVGHDVSRHNRGDGRESRYETRCEVTDSYHEEERIEGYLVTYVYNGQTYVRQMAYDPGRQLKIRVELTPA